MDYLTIVLRIIHIFSGVFWVGVALFNIGFLQPTVQATGAEGQRVMQHLSGKTRFLIVTYLAATLNMLSGVWMYWDLSRFKWEFTTASGKGLFLTIGGTFGVLAWITVIFVIRNIFNQLGAIGHQIQTQGSPPTSEQGAELQALGARLSKVGTYVLVLLIIALLGMSTAQNISL
ncbi:MAG: hypothetical protein FVQ83_06715 [Chloroflexi bacterium]|nr:hypothetical protein [Chloroflexota bacterium]